MQIKADEGYFFGLGAFETIGLAGKKPILMDWHRERLLHSLAELGIEADAETIDARVAAVLEELPETGEAQALKIAVSKENTVVTLRSNPYTAETYARGYAAATSPVIRNETSPLVRHKTMNYGDCILEKRRMHAQGIDEPLFFNSRGELTEGATTNIFLVLDGKLCTPPVSSGLLPGILRRWVLSETDAETRVLNREDLEHCEEAFLTNSLMGVLHICSVDGRELPTRTAADALMARYRKAFGL